MAVEFILSTRGSLRRMDGNTTVLGCNDLNKEASDLIHQSLKMEVQGRLKVSEYLLYDENFYPLIVAFEKISADTLAKNIRDYINFGFICTNEEVGAIKDLHYRETVIRLCVNFICSENR